MSGSSNDGEWSFSLTSEPCGQVPGEGLESKAMVEMIQAYLYNFAAGGGEEKILKTVKHIGEEFGYPLHIRRSA